MLPGGPEQRGAEGRTLKRWLVAWHAWHNKTTRQVTPPPLDGDSHLATVTGLVIRRATHHSMAAICFNSTRYSCIQNCQIPLNGCFNTETLKVIPFQSPVQPGITSPHVGLWVGSSLQK